MQSFEFPHLMGCMLHACPPCAPITAPALGGLQPLRSAVAGFPHHLTAMLSSPAEPGIPFLPFPRAEQDVF